MSERASEGVPDWRHTHTSRLRVAYLDRDPTVEPVAVISGESSRTPGGLHEPPAGRGFLHLVGVATPTQRPKRPAGDELVGL